MRVMLDAGATMPSRAHDSDAGYDLFARDAQIVPAKESAVFDTGVHIELPEGTAGLLVSKSGLNVKHDITSTGLIDSGYTGSIKVKLYNHGGYDYRVEKGDKVGQFVVIPVKTLSLKLSDTLDDSDRGNNGFGSTGR